MKREFRFGLVVCLLLGLVAIAALLLTQQARRPPVGGTAEMSGSPPVPPPPSAPPPAPHVAAPALAGAVSQAPRERRDEALSAAVGTAAGIEGGVHGGVVGGIVGGLPRRAPLGLAPPRMTRQADVYRGPTDFHTEAYDPIRDNPFLAATLNPLSTFSIDVDTASYANVRRFLAQGQLPPKDAVRLEELLNYFRYDYPEPGAETPFSVTTEVAACPWKPEHRLVLVGLRGRSIADSAVPPRRLTFLLDVSGSMDMPAKLPLLKGAMALLVETLREQDRVAIVVYAGSSGLVLPPTPGDRKAEIRDALASLEAGGSTAGGAGIQLAYRVAAEMFLPGAVNRVVLATDGDFNVGITSLGELSRLIEEKRLGGVFLSVLGFGEGNLKDSTMEMLADRGDGNYSYVDSLAEARKVLVSEAGGTLVTIAKDVKIQIELNPRRVSAYRLIGYENRLLRAEDFADDRKDAGEIGAGHSVTALYEIVPAGVSTSLPGVDPLRYQQPAPLSNASGGDELMTVKLRYKQPDGDTSRLVGTAVRDVSAPSSENVRFAAAVAEFGMLLRDSEHKGGSSWAQVRDLAAAARGRDAGGYREAFLALVRQAEELSTPRQAKIAR
ncbi:MAG TPA: VWA domain-containing protein [Vicinamibacteria bacterium]|nr:VWA domain-containing protein [Vicinamibacteria bacterium]